MDFIAWFCRECGGRCCTKFPVWQFLVDNKMMSIDFFEGVGTRKTTVTLAFRKRDYKSLDCFYHDIGGCPDFVKPDACRQWLCGKFNNFILGLPWGGGNVPKESTLRLHKAMI